MLDPNYDHSIDMWSLGCILYEMLAVSQTYNNKSDFKASERHAFKGDSCYPVSPLDPEAEGAISQNDQLQKIPEFMTLSKLDYSHLSDQN